jgi:hypothetical protein
VSSTTTTLHLPKTVPLRKRRQARSVGLEDSPYAEAVQAPNSCQRPSTAKRGVGRPPAPDAFCRLPKLSPAQDHAIEARLWHWAAWLSSSDGLSVGCVAGLAALMGESDVWGDGASDRPMGAVLPFDENARMTDRALAQLPAKLRMWAGYTYRRGYSPGVTQEMMDISDDTWRTYRRAAHYLVWQWLAENP